MFTGSTDYTVVKYSFKMSTATINFILRKTGDVSNYDFIKRQFHISVQKQKVHSDVI